TLRRLGSLDVGERSSSLDQIADPVAHDRHHVPIVDDVQLIAEPAVSWYDDRARFARDNRSRWNREVDETVERRELALHPAAALGVDHGKLSRVEHIARHDDIRSSEEREDVA